MKRRFALLAGLCLLLMVYAACGGGGDDDDRDEQADDDDSTPIDNSDDDDNNDDSADDDDDDFDENDCGLSEYLVGEWQDEENENLTLLILGNYQYYIYPTNDNLAILHEGQGSVDDCTFTFADTGGEDACGNDGVYKFNVSAFQLKLRVENDNCNARVNKLGDANFERL